MQRDLSRRDLLKLGGAVAAAGATGTVLDLGGSAEAQTPKRGGVFRLRSHVAPVHFDPHQTIAFSTMLVLSFAYSRLVKVKAGPSVVPGTQPIEGDLAESWSQPNDTTYVFKLRKGVRWHPKPPVNGRELTAEMIQLQRRTFDIAKRRDIIHDIQRHVAQQAWVLFGPSVSAVAAWEPYVKNFSPKYRPRLRRAPHSGLARSLNDQYPEHWRKHHGA